MSWIAVFMILFLLMRILVALVNLLTRTWPKVPDPVQWPGVSVLIPARNEADRIGQLLDDLSRQDYPDFSVCVYDDHSEDNTLDVLKHWTDRDPRFGYIQGGPLPKGWLGKNHACFQLAARARGKYYLFLDADVKIQPGLIRRLIMISLHFRLGLLSVFPRQIMHSLSEKLVVPLMNWVLVGLLPLRMTMYSSRSSLSAANGQCMLFDAEAYKTHQFHSHFRKSKTEDIHIARFMKQKGFRLLTLLGNDSISCRMYSGFWEAVNGFAKNVREYFGGSRFTTIAYLLLTSLAPFVVWTSFGCVAMALYLWGVLLLKFLIALASRQNPWLNAMLTPLQHLAFALVVMRSLYLDITGKTLWKGRALDNPESA